mmetsp:Transcript_3512/g.10895  ORF Transcript_3512/g.10895 Transcript_3512/m.10895 type:complete len:407 (+) Transcript_3512:504-1724(+)
MHRGAEEDGVGEVVRERSTAERRKAVGEPRTRPVHADPEALDLGVALERIRGHASTDALDLGLAPQQVLGRPVPREEGRHERLEALPQPAAVLRQGQLVQDLAGQLLGAQEVLEALVAEAPRALVDGLVQRLYRPGRGPLARAALGREPHHGGPVDADGAEGEGLYEAPQGMLSPQVLPGRCHQRVGHDPMAPDEVVHTVAAEEEGAPEGKRSEGPLLGSHVCGLLILPDRPHHLGRVLDPYPQGLAVCVEKTSRTQPLEAWPHLLRRQAADVHDDLRARWDHALRTCLAVAPASVVDALQVPLREAAEAQRREVPVEVQGPVVGPQRLLAGHVLADQHMEHHRGLRQGLAEDGLLCVVVLHDVPGDELDDVLGDLCHHRAHEALAAEVLVLLRLRYSEAAHGVRC